MLILPEARPPRSPPLGGTSYAGKRWSKPPALPDICSLLIYPSRQRGHVTAQGFGGGGTCRRFPSSSSASKGSRVSGRAVLSVPPGSSSSLFSVSPGTGIEIRPDGDMKATGREIHTERHVEREEKTRRNGRKSRRERKTDGKRPGETSRAHEDI